MREWDELEALNGEGTFACYRADPPGDARAAIIVLQEIFGVNEGIRAKADRWAALGYRALAPDLFWRAAPRIELDSTDKDQFARALELMQQSDLDAAVRDIEATIRHARALGGAGAKVGVVGYCWGGLLAYLAAARTDASASVGYYGVRIDSFLNESHAIANPLMLHIATRDGFVPPEAQAAIKAGLAGNAHVTLHEYDADHAFAREAGPTRVPDLADLADERTQTFFAQALAA